MVVVVHPYNSKDLVFRWPVDLGVYLTAKRLLVMPGKTYQPIERTLDLHLLFIFPLCVGIAFKCHILNFIMYLEKAKLKA